MPTLRHECEQALGSWREHLSQSWLNVLGTTELSFSQMPLGVNAVGHIFPSLNDNSPHVFSAFDDLPPTDVKIVLIGEDPYPCVNRATGRSFEQGDLDSWVPPPGGNEPSAHCTPSLQSIVQQLATFRTGRSVYSRSQGGWGAFMRDIRPGAPLHNCIPTPQAMFDHWQDEGVLMLNAALTFTNESQKRYHRDLWRPFICSIISYFVCRQEATVFLCFGRRAQRILSRCAHRPRGRPNLIQAILDHRDLLVYRAHPRCKRCFLHGTNVFEDANAKLTAAGRHSIDF